MNISFTLNNKKVTWNLEPDQRVREALYAHGCVTVRDSDDGEGFTGSDIIIYNGMPRSSNLMLCFQLEGADIRTAESLKKGKALNDVQEAMIKAGVVQSAYNSPTAALILTHLLENKPDATRNDVKEALSSLFIRDAGYEHFYLAVRLVQEKRKTGMYQSAVSPTFRDNLSYIGKPMDKVDGYALVSGDKVFVEDKVEPGAYVLKVLRSPYAMAYIRKIDTKEAEALEGVEAVITHENCPDVYYMQAGQGNPEPSPYDRRLLNRKVRHVGDRVAAVVAKDEETALKALSLIHVEYEPLKPVFTVEEAMADGASLGCPMFQVLPTILMSTTGMRMKGTVRSFTSSLSMGI